MMAEEKWMEVQNGKDRFECQSHQQLDDFLINHKRFMSACNDGERGGRWGPWLPLNFYGKKNNNN
jgi:hypothetical protein